MYDTIRSTLKLVFPTSFKKILLIPLENIHKNGISKQYSFAFDVDGKFTGGTIFFIIIIFVPFFITYIHGCLPKSLNLYKLIQCKTIGTEEENNLKSFLKFKRDLRVIGENFEKHFITLKRFPYFKSKFVFQYFLSIHIQWHQHFHLSFINFKSFICIINFRINSVC